MDSENPFRAQAGRGAFDSRRWLLEVAEQKRKKKKKREREKKKEEERKSAAYKRRIRMCVAHMKL